MATGFLNQYAAATTDKTFVQRVTMAMLQTANNLSSEATSTTNHANRMSLMKAVTNQPDVWGILFAMLIAANGIDGTSTDAQIQAQISSSWNAMAGSI